MKIRRMFNLLFKIQSEVLIKIRVVQLLLLHLHLLRKPIIILI